MRFIWSILLLCAAAYGENFEAVAATGSLPDAPSHRSFWSVENKVEFGILGGLITADAITTQQGLSQGFREANPLLRPLVTRGAAGEAAASALGFGAGLGATYLLHRMHYYRAERVTLRCIIAGESAVVGRNIAELR